MKKGIYEFSGNPLEQRIRDTFVGFFRLCAVQQDPHVFFGYGDCNDGKPGIVVSLGDSKFAYTPDEARALARVGEVSLSRLVGTEAACYAEPLSSFVLGLRAVADKAEAEFPAAPKP